VKAVLRHVSLASVSLFIISKFQESVFSSVVASHKLGNFSTTFMTCSVNCSAVART